MLASIPSRNPRFPSGLASKPSFTARCVNDRTVPAGLRTCVWKHIKTKVHRWARPKQLTSQRPATPISLKDAEKHGRGSPFDFMIEQSDATRWFDAIT